MMKMSGERKKSGRLLQINTTATGMIGGTPHRGADGSGDATGTTTAIIAIPTINETVGEETGRMTLKRRVAGRVRPRPSNYSRRLLLPMRCAPSIPWGRLSRIGHAPPSLAHLSRRETARAAFCRSGRNERWCGGPGISWKEGMTNVSRSRSIS